MTKLQNDFTTPEQSKRLIELGVPKNSANHYYGKDGKLHYIDGTIPYSLLWETGCMPCWSVGRLIEIMALCYKFDFPDSGSVQIYTTDVKKGTVVDILISDIERFINKIDFSKLEK